MNSVKCYKSFIGFWPRMILYLIFPIVVAVLTYIQLGVFKHDWMISVVFCLTMFSTLALVLLLDRWSIGPIYLKKGQDDELIKTSPRGAEFLKKVLRLDIIFRSIIYLVLILIIVAVTVITGSFEMYSGKIISSAVLCILALDGVSNLTVMVMRHTEGSNMFILVMYGLEFALIPAAINIFLGITIVIYIVACIYLILDVICITYNVKEVNKLVSVDWYTD